MDYNGVQKNVKPKVSVSLPGDTDLILSKLMPTESERCKVRFFSEVTFVNEGLKHLLSQEIYLASTRFLLTFSEGYTQCNCWVRSKYATNSDIERNRSIVSLQQNIYTCTFTHVQTQQHIKSTANSHRYKFPRALESYSSVMLSVSRDSNTSPHSIL